jgi:hypothetical protein
VRATVIAASSSVFVFVGGAGVVTALNPAPPPDDHEPSISGEPLQRAANAALAATGEGRVTDSEVGDEESYYEVEVTLPDGRHVDVQLDESFAVVDSTPDGRDGDGG